MNDLTSPMSKKKILLALVEVFRSTCPAGDGLERFHFPRNAYRQWATDVQAVAELFGYTYSELNALINGGQTYRQIDAERLKRRDPVPDCNCGIGDVYECRFHKETCALRAWAKRVQETV